MKVDVAEYDAESAQSFDQMYPFLASQRRFTPRKVADFERVLETARNFRREYVDPNALRIDRRVMSDPTYVADDAIRAACERGFFSMMIPKAFGGPGLSLGAVMVGMEEISAGCVGLANLINVHGLALSMVAATGDLPTLERLGRGLAEGEKCGRPYLLSTAITEPGAGTDVEDIEFLKTAKLVCEARPVPGGYRLNGRKVFISNGSVARAHVVVAPTDRSDPVGTSYGFLVESDTAGLSVGRVERKMGQKACPAVELVFDNCFLPESSRLGMRTFAGRALELVLGATRGGVAVFGTGVARGAFERALRYARTHKLSGRWLIDEQWVQLRLADMLRNVLIGRASYMEAMFSNELFGLTSVMSGSPVTEISRWIPRAVIQSPVVSSLMTSKAATRTAQRKLHELDDWKNDAACAFGAAAKVTATDLAIANCHLALDIMGTGGLRHDQGMEKLYRDSKLLQIYEGTNQLNRIELYQRGVNRAARATRAATTTAAVKSATTTAKTVAHEHPPAT